MLEEVTVLAPAMAVIPEMRPLSPINASKPATTKFRLLTQPLTLSGELSTRPDYTLKSQPELQEPRLLSH